jgi:hypothetical protein
MNARTRWASNLMLVADAGMLFWTAMAALAPERLLGPRSMPILAAGYEGYTQSSWSELVSGSPRTADFLTLLFRMYGLYGVVLSLLALAIAATAFRRGERWAWWALLVGNTIAYVGAMTYDRIVHAIGPFEAMEYVGLAVVFAALALTVPFRAAARLAATTS